MKVANFVEHFSKCVKRFDDETLESFGVKITDGPDIVTPD